MILTHTVCARCGMSNTFRLEKRVDPKGQHMGRCHQCKTPQPQIILQQKVRPPVRQMWRLDPNPIDLCHEDPFRLDEEH